MSHTPINTAFKGQSRLKGSVLVSTCAFLLFCGTASRLSVSDAELAGTLVARKQVPDIQSEYIAAIDDPFVTREVALSGVVEGSFEASLAKAKAPAELSRRLVEALSLALEPDGRLDSGDTFYVRYAQAFEPGGGKAGAARLLAAEVTTAAKGRIALYSFRPTRGSEQLWLASGEALARPAMRLPLATISVSSGFGVRADPFDQPRQGGLGAPSQLGRIGATINAATPRGIALGLAPGPGQRAGTAGPAGKGGGATFVMHNGLDLVAPIGTPVLAASPGTVVGAAPNGGYGNWIRIQHAEDVATVYGHLSAFAPGIHPGVEVTRGQLIGFVGSTGRSTGPHLHFEIVLHGKAIDPLTFPATKRVQLAGTDLERFRKQVQEADALRQGEAAFRLAGGVH